MTLIVVADAREDAADVGETLASLMKDHPSRAIVVRARILPGGRRHRTLASPPGRMR